MQCRVDFLKEDFVMEFTGKRISLKEKINLEESRKDRKECMDVVGLDIR